MALSLSSLVEQLVRLIESINASHQIVDSSAGIGWMMAEALAANGASKVFILGRRQDVLAKAAAKYPEIMVPVGCDVSSKESLEAAASLVAKDTGYVNLLVANSGISGAGVRYDGSLSISDLRTQLLGIPMEKFTETFHVNVTGAWFTMVAFLELLDAGNKHAVSGKAGAFGSPVKEGGKAPSVQSQVVFTSSLAGFSRAHWTGPDYGGSKAAVIHLMKQASTNLAAYGIRVNSIAPGRRSSYDSMGCPTVSVLVLYGFS